MTEAAIHSLMCTTLPGREELGLTVLCVDHNLNWQDLEAFRPNKV